MNAIILAIGDELTSGQTHDTNGPFLSRELAARGIRTLARWTVGDDRGSIAEAFTRAAGAAELVLATGGLGPTADDLTRDGLADAMGVSLVLNAECEARIAEFFRSLGRAMNPVNRVQALLPAGAEALPNALGTAPGIAATLGQTRIFVLPGVPHEMRQMFASQVAPRLPVGTGAFVQRVIHTYGRGESDVGAALVDLMRRGANPAVGTTVAGGVVSVRVVAQGDSADSAGDRAGRTAAEVRRRLGEIVFGEDDQTLAGAVGQLLRARGQTLALAESCTGGLIGQMITTVPGASEYYLGGVIAYANEIKKALLGVGEKTLLAGGAVSEAVAREMAEGCRARFAADWAIGITGIAGPTGGGPDKPVGLVYVSVAGPGGVRVFRHVLSGDRDFIRTRAALTALNHLRVELLRA